MKINIEKSIISFWGISEMEKYYITHLKESFFHQIDKQKLALAFCFLTMVELDDGLKYLGF